MRCLNPFLQQYHLASYMYVYMSQSFQDIIIQGTSPQDSLEETPAEVAVVGSSQDSADVSRRRVL